MGGACARNAADRVREAACAWTCLRGRESLQGPRGMRECARDTPFAHVCVPRVRTKAHAHAFRAARARVRSSVRRRARSRAPP
eukprot:1555626-Pleurochrysis_carterae.AAC.1